MTTKEIIEKLRDMISNCSDSETTLLIELISEADGWQMRLDELAEKNED